MMKSDPACRWAGASPPGERARRADAAAALLLVIAAIVARKPEKKLASAAEAPSRRPGKPGAEDALQ